MSEWKNTSIGSEATLQRGFDITAKDFQAGSIPVISSGGLAGYHDTAMVKGPGVVLGRKGTLGTVFFVDSDFWPHDTTLWVKDFHGNDHRFVYYFFKQLDTLRMDVGSANPTLNRNHVHPIAVKWPPIEEQRAIAWMLGTLDDKIELNRHMNETLEAIARAIFKSWFVDFDPVIAKATGKRGLAFSARVLNLFPSTVVDSPKGKIPAGWQLRPIGDVTRVVGGSTPRTDEPSFWENGQIAWATPKDLAPLTSPVLLDTERHITEKGLEQISSGLLPKGTVLLSSRAPIGYTALSEIPLAINQGFIALVCDKELPNYYVLNWIQSHLEEIKAHANGTTFMEISKAIFRPLLAAVPPNSVLNEFEHLVSPIYDRIVANLRESGTLIKARDLLLPKLISGEIRLREAKTIFEAHA